MKVSYATSLDFAGPVFTHQITLAADWEREVFRNTDPFGSAFTGTRSARNFGLVGEYRLAADRFDLSAAFLHTLGFSISISIPVLQVISVVLMLTTGRAQGLTDHVLGTAALNRIR